MNEIKSQWLKTIKIWNKIGPSEKCGSSKNKKQPEKFLKGENEAKKRKYYYCCCSYY